MSGEQGQKTGILRGVFVGYFVLLLHLLLIVGLGVVVVLLKGVYDFRWPIFIVGVLLISASGYLIYRRIKQSNRRISDIMNDPSLRDRTLEVSLFGGMASVKLGHRSEAAPVIDASEVRQVRQLEASSSQVKELSQLATMLDNELVSREEFERLKQDLMK